MSNAKDRRLVLGAFAKLASADVPTVATVAGILPRGKAVTPALTKSASFDSKAAGDLAGYLEKISAGWTPKKPHEPFSGKVAPGIKAPPVPGVKAPPVPVIKPPPAPAALKTQTPVKTAAQATATRDASSKATQQPTPPGIVDLAVASDTPLKKAEEKKPEPKESENESEKKAGAPHQALLAALGGGGGAGGEGGASLPEAAPKPPISPEDAAGPAPEAGAEGGAPGKQDILSMLSQGLGSLGSKSMSGVGGVLGGMGMPGAEKQLQMWSEDPGVSKGVGGGIGALGSLLVAYLVRKMMAGKGEGEEDQYGMMQEAGVRYQKMSK